MVFSLRENTPGQNYSTVMDLKDVTKSLYVPVITFIYECKTNRFVYHKKELIESGEYKDFDLMFKRKL